MDHLPENPDLLLPHLIDRLYPENRLSSLSMLTMSTMRTTIGKERVFDTNCLSFATKEKWGWKRKILSHFI
jgi:hypothetical protein